MLSIESVIEIFREYSSIAIPISILMSILISLVGVLPSIFVTGANIIFFGPYIGFIISLIGETVGGFITFKVYRLGLKKSIENIASKNNLLKKIVNSSGKRAGFLIFEGRLLPFMPSGFVTLAASISNVNSFIFVLATCLGKIPSIALEAIISYDVINIEENFIRLLITLISLLLIVVTLKRKE